MRQNCGRTTRVGAAFAAVILLVVFGSSYGQVAPAPQAANERNASNFAELKKWIENAAVGSIVLLKSIKLQQQLLIARSTPLSIVGRAKAGLISINCQFLGNEADAAFELKASSFFSLTNVSFSDCGAALTVLPGAAGSSSLDVTLDSILFMGSSGPATDVGGAVSWQVPSGNFNIRRSTFTHAKARQGGAIFAAGGGSVLISDSVFTANSASTSGGALMIGPGLTVQLTRCNFTRNNAPQRGGAVVVDTLLDNQGEPATPSSLTIESSGFSSNSAGQVGGALLCNYCSKLSISDTRFETNKAAAATGSGVAALGGGLALLSNKTELTLVATSFVGNSADFGGAIYLNNSCVSTPTTPCPATSLRIEEAISNKATQSGAFLYTLDPSPAPLCCGGYLPCPKQDLSGCLTPALHSDLMPQGGKIPTIGSPPSIVKIVSATLNDSTLSVKVVLQGGDVNGGGMVSAMLPEPLSLTIGVTSRDGKAVVLGGNTSITTTKTEVLWPPLAIFPPPNADFGVVVNMSGAWLATVVTGHTAVPVPPCLLGSYNDTSKGVCDSCGQHNLFSMNSSIPCFNCINGASCQKGLMLPKSEYWMAGMLLPQLQWCPLDGACNSRHRLSALLSTTLAFQQALATAPDKAWAQVAAHNATFMDKQCSAGYTGTFCGQCEKGYGLSGRKCIKCRGGAAGTAMLLVLCVVFLVAVMSVTVLTHVKGSRLLSLAEAGRTTFGGGFGAPAPLQHSNGMIHHQHDHSDLHDGSPWHLDDDGQRPHLFDLAMVLDNANKFRHPVRHSGADLRPGHRLATHGAAPTLTSRQLGLDSTFEEQQAAEYFLLTAMIKVLVTYVQLVGMLPGLKLRWPSELRRFLFFVDYTSCAGWLPLSCAVPGSEAHKAISTTVLYVLVFPVCVIILTVFIWAVVLRRVLSTASSSALTRADAEAVGDFVSGRSQGSLDEPGVVFHTSFENKKRVAAKRCTCAVVQCVYYLYPFVSMRIMQVFVCMQVGEMSRALWSTYADKVPQGMSAVAPGFYWLQSSAVRCFSDPSHRSLAITLGVLGFSFWIVGVPMLLLWGAYMHRYSGRLQSGALSWGFVYLEYRPELWFWEFLVCLRKLAVMFCTQLLAFGRGPLSAGQLYASMVFVLSGWLVHEVWRPFTDSALASMDRCSSFGVIVVLVVIAFKLNSQADRTIDTALMVVVILAVLGALLFMLGKISLQILRLWRGARYLREAEARGDSDWLGSMLEGFLERATGLFRRNRNPLNDLAKRAWTRPVLRHAASLEREMTAPASRLS